MKVFLVIPLLLLTISVSAQSEEFLLPENFFGQKGETETVHLFTGDGLKSTSEIKYRAAAISKLTLYHGSKPVDLKTVTKEGEPPLNNFTTQPGLSMLELNETAQIKDNDRDDFVQELNELGYDKLAQKLGAGNRLRVREKRASYLKTIFSSDEVSGNVYEKPVHSDFEIILKQSPFKANYGDDITCVLLYMGKPVRVAHVQFYIRSLGGNIFKEDKSTDNDGVFYIKLSREGIYMLSSIDVEAGTTPGIDVETRYTSITFAFSSSNTMPNTYREFGFGNLH